MLFSCKWDTLYKDMEIEENTFDGRKINTECMFKIDKFLKNKNQVN